MLDERRNVVTHGLVGDGPVDIGCPTVALQVDGNHPAAGAKAAVTSLMVDVIP